MRLVIQRAGKAELWIDNQCTAKIGRGLMVLFGTRQGDCEESCQWLALKTVNLRLFEDDQGKMNRSVIEEGGEVLIVSQFTLYADTRKGRRPSYNEAMEPVAAEKLYDRYVQCVRDAGVPVQTGVFGAKMEIKFTNDGPVTIIVDHDL
ncbi:MAG: D-aminoacyl-tRNA deacylase [bacterium]